MANNNLLRRGLCAVVSFIMSVSLFALILCITLSFSVSKSFTKFIIKQSGYVEQSFDSLMTDLEDLTIPSGLPIDFFEDKLSKSLYEERVFEAFSCNISKTEPSFNYDTIQKEFYNLSYEYAKTQNYAVSDDATESLKGFAKECADGYVQKMNPSVIKFVLGYFKTIGKYLSFAVIGSLLFTLFSLVLLYLLSRGKDFIKHLVFVLSSDVLFCFVFPTVILLTNEIKKIALTSQSIYSFTVSYIEGILKLILFFVLLLSIGIVVLFKIKPKLTK